MVAMGRSSFPLFAYLAAMGEQYSTNLIVYLSRLVLLGLLTQPVYAHFSSLLFEQQSPLNILFGLAMGVVTLRWIRAFHHPLFKLAVVLLSSGIALIANIEGGLTTIPTIVLMSTFQNSFAWWASYTLFGLAGVWILSYPPISLFQLLAPLILLGYNGRQGPKSYLFYLIYPLHFLLLIGINRITHTQAI